MIFVDALEKYFPNLSLSFFFMVFGVLLVLAASSNGDKGFFMLIFGLEFLIGGIAFGKQAYNFALADLLERSVV